MANIAHYNELIVFVVLDSHALHLAPILEVGKRPLTGVFIAHAFSQVYVSLIDPLDCEIVLFERFGEMLSVPFGAAVVGEGDYEDVYAFVGRFGRVF